MKDYMTKELNWYVLACVTVFLFFHFQISLTNEMTNYLQVIELLLASSIISIFTFLSNSIFGGNFKFFLVYLGSPMASECIFEKIKRNPSILHTTWNLISEKYADVYNNLPVGKDRLKYQSDCWYKIYSKYKNAGIESINISAKEFRLCRDMNVATLCIAGLYAIFSLISVSVSFNYCAFLIVMIVATNLSARTKGCRWVENVLLIDMFSPKISIARQTKSDANKKRFKERKRRRKNAYEKTFLRAKKRCTDN